MKGNGVEVWHGICDKSWEGYGPWVRHVDHAAIIAAWEATGKAIQDHVNMLLEENKRLSAPAEEVVDAKHMFLATRVVELEAQIERWRQERDALAGRSYRLAVAILGGEDVPGEANGVDTEVLERMAHDAEGHGRRFYADINRMLRERIADLESRLGFSQ